MRRYLKSIFLFAFIAGYVEHNDFELEPQSTGIVIEAHLSDKSFNDTQLYPSDGQYPSVRLSRTTAVTNVRPVPIIGALVHLQDDQGGIYPFESSTEPGLYLLQDPEFKAAEGVRYKLRVHVEGEAEIESSWEALPEAQASIGEVGFNEVTRPLYRYEAGKQVVRDVRGIETYITVPENTGNDPVYYRWSFDPAFVFEAALASHISPIKRCWVRNPPYLREYALREDHTGGYRQPLFFMETIRNHMIYNEFTVLVKQHILSRDHFHFWREMQERNMGGLLQDTPPYNLKSNFTVVNGDVAAFGYFAPVRELAVRWYFTRTELSYTVEDTSREDCLKPKMPPPAPQCEDCRDYEWGGTSTNVKPTWWRD